MQRSTEQLTHCSTATLEEILDNSDGVTTRTVSEKIMSICKNTIRWVLFLDILLALSVFVLLAVLEFGTVPQQHIGFYCNDPKISFKFMGDTISITLLIVGCLLIPIIVMWLSEFICYSADSYDAELGYAGSRAKQIWLWYGHYSIGIIALTFICDVMKTLIGEPRPHFLDTCKPREAENCTNEYVEKYTCTNTEHSEWFVSDSSKSFPSGHSALSMFTTTFIVWYLQRRLPDRTFFLKPWLQCIIFLWTVICSLTRIGDNRHHWWDVLAGIILGFAFSMLTVVVPCRKFHLNQNVSQIYSEPVESEQINFNERKQNAKKLLHETIIDPSESRELKNIKSSTWRE
ncbi:phospholipid phosphatase 1-like isoform X1 [Bombus pyrosoma]|uniref:phospholipid phosphatase 1-like isoform X1 n=2 Tax=Bombus pyrosoma TaxID=396416 RepID=UPI001CB8ADE9|nr:phospholipid phosphatase 1-like isoform X1 [Bombus pyrosoma]